MPIASINIGAVADDNNADTVRAAFAKANQAIADANAHTAVLGNDGSAATARVALGLGGVPINYTDRGNWTTGTVYNANNLVHQGTSVYAVLVAHTSGTFATDLAAGKMTVHQGMTREELALPSGAGAVGFGAGQVYLEGTVGYELKRQTTFEAFGAAGDDVADDTAEIQAAITATSGRLLGRPGAIYRISAPLIGHSGLHIDLQGATIRWVGDVVSSGNKAAKWDNAVFRVGAVAPGAVYKNVGLTNGTILVADWGCGISLKRVEGFELAGLTITNAQAAGIQVADCINGTITRCTLTDCAANPASGFDPATDLEAWSDGILLWYGSQAVTIENCTVTNTRTATGRCGICVDDALAGSVESGRKTSAITVRANRVKGYDRQVHVEYAYATTVSDCDLEFIDSGSKTFRSIFVDWNTEDTTWSNNRGRTTKGMAMVSGSTNVQVTGGSLKKTGADTGNCFLNQSGNLARVQFRGVELAFASGSTNIYRWAAVFEDCTISSTAYMLCSYYESTVKLSRCKVTNAAFWTTAGGLSTDSIEYSDCEFIGFSGTNYCANVPFGSLYIRKAKLPAGDVRFICPGPVVVNDMELFTLPTFDGSPVSVQLDGQFLVSSSPTFSGFKGQSARNTNTTPGGIPGWVCTANGVNWRALGAVAVAP